MPSMMTYNTIILLVVFAENLITMIYPSFPIFALALFKIIFLI